MMVGRRSNTTSTTAVKQQQNQSPNNNNGSVASSSTSSNYTDSDLLLHHHHRTMEEGSTTGTNSVLQQQSSKFRGTTFSWRTKALQYLLVLRRLSLHQACCLVACIALIVPYSIHRTIVWYMTSKEWVFSPIMHLERECPTPAYPTLTSTPEGRETAQNLKICLTTLTDEKTKRTASLFRRFIRWRNYDNILELTWKSKQAYADKHGYHLFDSSDIVKRGRPAQWSKITAVQRLLTEEQCDWALWMDADTVFMNTNKKIIDFLPLDPDKSIIVAVDRPNPGYNSGTWMVKQSDFGLEFLQKWWDMKNFVRLPGQSMSGDNDAFKVLLNSYDKEVFEKHIAVPPRCTINAFAKFLRPWVLDSMSEQELQAQPWYMSEDYYHKGDWLVHTPGYDNKAGVLTMLMDEIQ